MSTYDPNDDLLKWAEGLGKTPSPPVSKSKGDKRAEALRRAAERLGVDPVDLGAVISFETGGTFDPHKVGGEGNKYRGLIQFGPDEQRRYYNPKDTFETQLENGVVPFLRDRFKAAGRSTKGAKLEDLYTTIIAGNPKANRNAKDAFGTSARSGTRRIMQEHRPKVLRDIFGGQVPSADTNVTFDFNSALKEADELLSGTQPVANPPFDFNTALSEADQLLGGNQPATQLPPTNPVPTFLRSPNAPMPETITTIEKQATSALDANSPRAAVLLTDPSQIRLLTPSLTRTLKQVSTPDGILLVNEAKARQLGATDYVRDMAKLIGKVDDVGRDTGSGPTVVTLDRDGNELASSRVTSLLSAKMQAEIDKASFPDSAKQQIVDAQDVVAKREDDLKKQIQTLGGLTPESVAHATAPPALPGPAVPEPTMEQLPWEGDLNAEYAAYVKYAQQNKLPVMSKQQFIVDVVGKAGQGEAQATGYQTQPNVPAQQNRPQQGQQAQRQTRPGETASISRQRQVGQPTSDLNRSVIEYTAPKSITTEEDALRQALRATGELTPNEINRFIANRKRDGIKLLAQPLSVSRTIQVPYYVIAEAKGDASRVEGDIAMEQAQTPVGTAISQKKYGRLPETQAEQAIDKRIREKDYVVFQKLTEALQAPWMLMSPTAGVKFASDPSDEWLQAEKKRLKEQYGSYANAYDAEQYYQNTTGLEKTVRTFNQGARSFLKNLVGGTAKTAVFLSQLQEDNDPINQLLPDNAKIGLRNAGNIADFISRLVTSGSASTAYKEMDWVKSLDGIDRQQFFKAIQEFDKAVGDDPVLKGRFLGSLGDAGGSAASFIALGAMMPSLVTTNFWGTTRNWGQAVSGIAQMAGGGYEEGKRSGLDESTARKYGLIQGALGVTEMLGAGAELAQFLKSPGLRRQMAQALVEVGKATLREGKQEFAQEVFQTTAGKAVMEYLKDNDESTWRKLYNAVNRLPKQLSESIANEGIIAMITGGVMGGGGRALQLATQSADTTVDARPVNEIPASDGSTTVVTSSQQPQIFTDKQGRRFEVIEDLGDKVRVRNERGGEQIRNKSGLTEVNEKTPDVSKPTAPVVESENVRPAAVEGEVAFPVAGIWKNKDSDQPVIVTGVAGTVDGEKYYTIEGSNTAIPAKEFEQQPSAPVSGKSKKPTSSVDAEPLVQDQAVEVSTKSENIDTKSSNVDAVNIRPTLTGEAKKPVESKKQIRYREDMPSGLVEEAPLNPQTLTGAKERLKEVETELQEERRKGTTDAKMGISNERAWQAAVDRIEADPNQEVVSLDINRMKEANDTTSHTGIDKNVLAPIGAAVRKVLKANGIDERNAFRTGGDEVVVAVPKGKAQKIRDEIEKEVGVIEIVAEKDFTNDRTGESFKKGDRIPVTISGTYGSTVADAETTLGERKRLSKQANPVRRPQVATYSRTLPKTLSGNASSFKGISQSVFRNSQKFLNSPNLATLSNQSLGDLNVKSQRIVLGHMIRSAQQFEIGDVVIESVPVNVMDVLVALKGASNMSLHDKAVLKNILAVDEQNAVSLRVDVADAILRQIAKKTSIIAKTSPRFADSSDGTAKGGSALLTKNNDSPSKTSVLASSATKLSSAVKSGELSSALGTGKVKGHDVDTPIINVVSGESESQSGSPTSSLPNNKPETQSPARPAASEADAAQKDAPSLASLPIGELRKRASEAGIDPKQNKAKLIKALETKGEKAMATESMKAPQSEGESLKMAAGGNVLDSLYDEKGVNYERVKDVAGRIESGELEIVRLDPAGEQGRIAGGQRNVEATLILAANEAASEAAGSRTHPVKRQERILENYARQQGIWFDVKDFVREQQGYISKGVEAFVHRADDKSVHKLIDYKRIDRHLTPLDFIDNRISIFNHLFPETAYELVGFTRDGDGDFRFVVKQPFIHDAVYTSPVERQNFMRDKGLSMTDKYGESFASDLHKAQDLHEKNALINKDGTIFVIDSVTKPNYAVEPLEIVEPESLKMAAGEEQTETEAFKKWFGDSKVVDADGKPLRVFHGTERDFERFEARKPTRINLVDGKEIQTLESWDTDGSYTENPEAYHWHLMSDLMALGSPKRVEEFRRKEIVSDSPSNRRYWKDFERLKDSKVTHEIVDRPSGDAAWFTPDTNYSFISRQRGDGSFAGGQVMPVYLSIQNPKYVDHSEVEGGGRSWNVEKYKQEGYDGLIAATRKDDLTYTGWDGATQIVAFYPNQIKSAIGNRGTFDPNEDSILKMAADDSSLERFRDYAYAHTQTVLEDAKSEIKEVDGQTVLELNEAGAELARRVEASATGKKVDQFYGSTYTTGQLKKLAQTAKEWADRYEEKGYTADQVKSMRDLAANLDTLAEKGGAGVVYIFDFALPHETHHKLVLDALGGKAFPKQAIAELEALDIWNANPTITTPDGQTKSFNSAYPSLSKQHKVFEMAAMLETGEISHSDKDRFLDIFARGILEVTTELDPVTFARILNYANTQASDTQRDRTEQTDSEPDGRPDGTASTESEGNGERADDPRTGERASGRTADDAKSKTEKGQRIAAFSRILGQEYPYTPQDHSETDRLASQLISDKGIEQAINEAIYGQPSAEGMRVLQWELERLNGLTTAAVNKGNDEEANAYATQAADLASKIIQRQVATGQEVEINKRLLPLSPEAALLTAQRLLTYTKGPGAQLSGDQTKAIIQLAEELKVERAKNAEAEENVAKLRRRIKALETERPERKRSTPQKKMLEEYRREKPKLLEDLRNLFPNSPVFNGDAEALRMVAGDSDILRMAATRDDVPLDADTIAKLAKYAAGEILEGKPYKVLIDEIEAITGAEMDTVKEIHAMAVDNLRGASKELSDTAKERIKLRQEHYRQATHFVNGEVDRDKVADVARMVKGRLNSEIKKLEEEIETKQLRKKGEPVSTPEIETLKARAKKLKAERDEVLGLDKIKEQKHLEQAINRTKKAIDDLRERIKKHDFTPKEKKTAAESLELRSLRAERDILSDKLAELRKLKNTVPRNREIEMSNVTRRAMQDDRYKDDEPLIEAIERLTGAYPKSINDVINDLREIYPEMSMADLADLARKAQAITIRLKQEMAEEKDKLKGIMAEQRAAMIKSRIAKQKATIKLNRFLNNLANDPNWIKRMNDDFRAKFVLNFGTQLFNVTQALTVSTPAEILMDLFEVGLKNIGLRIGDTPDINVKDILLPYAYIAGNYRHMAESALSEFPDQFYQVHSGLLGDIELEKLQTADRQSNIASRTIHKWFDKNQILNDKLAHLTGAKLQEMHFRNAIVAAAFDQIIRRKSGGTSTLEQAIANNTVRNFVTEQDAQFAANKAMRVTFAALIDDKPGRALKSAYDKLDHYVPIFLNPVVYARFTYTTTKLMVLNPITFGILNSAKLGGTGYTTRDIASGVLAWSGIATAAALMATFGDDDDDWYTLKFGDTTVDIRRWYPASTFFYMAHLLRRAAVGKPVFKGNSIGAITKELLEGFASLETDYFTYGAGMELVQTGGEKLGGTKEWSDVGASGARFAGNALAGYARFFKPMRDVLAQFDKEEAKSRFYNDTATDKFIKEISRSVPLIARAYNAETNKDAKGNDILQPFPAGRLVGINVVHPSYLRPKQTPATAWATKLFRFAGSGQTMTAEQRKAASITRAIKNAIRRGDDVDIKQRLQEIKQSGELSKGKIDRLKNDLEMSELEAAVKWYFNATKEKEVNDLRKVWSYATEKEKAGLRKILKSKPGRTPEFNQEFGL